MTNSDEVDCPMLAHIRIASMTTFLLLAMLMLVSDAGSQEQPFAEKLRTVEDVQALLRTVEDKIRQSALVEDKTEEQSESLKKLRRLRELLQELLRMRKRKTAKAELDALSAKAEQGDVEAQLKLGRRYASGEDVSHDNRQAVYWFRKAAEQGNAEAQFELGGRYAIGSAEDANITGVLQDSHEAVHWLQKAADQGNVDAQFALGVFLTGSELVSFAQYIAHPWRKALEDNIPRDYVKAVYWLRKAAEQGNANAQFELGAMYLKGLGVIEDEIQAYAWLSLASMQGDKAHGLRDDLRERLTTEQLAEARALARKLAARIEAGQ